MPRVFLSPSTQEWNKYYTSGNEEYYMNLLADKMEPYLRSSGIEFTRNSPEKNVTGAITDSNSDYYDVHLALHTNAGGGEFAGKLRGIDAYYSPYSKLSNDLAVIITNNLQNIYPLQNKTQALPTTSLAEVTRTKAVAVLVELGYHDNPLDEAWLTSNLDSIARSLVQSLADYFGIPFIEPGIIYQGVVTTDGSGLNLRAFPSMQSRIITSIPNNAEVTVYGQYGNWYVVKYKDNIGYSSVDFITLK
ncbi:MAG: N-acetylmuramoyl-L-alanine amidase [Oscillospiraceae bacterium]